MYDTDNKPAPSEIGAMEAKPTNIELVALASANNGGYIDFHYNGSTADYTSRIMESAEGKLSLEAANGIVVSQVDPSTAVTRNIFAGTSDMTAGSSTLTTGVIYLVYE